MRFLLVTEIDIDRSRWAEVAYNSGSISSYARAESCPIAQALRRTFPDYPKVWVSFSRVRIATEDYSKVINFAVTLPIKKFIEYADDSHDTGVKPTKLLLKEI